MDMEQNRQTIQKREGLFPSASVIRKSALSTSEKVSGLDWLSNKSFNRDGAQSAAQKHGPGTSTSVDTAHISKQTEGMGYALLPGAETAHDVASSRTSDGAFHEQSGYKSVDERDISKFVQDVRHSVKHPDVDSFEDESQSSSSSEDDQYGKGEVKKEDATLKSRIHTGKEEFRRGEKRHRDNKHDRHEKKKKKHRHETASSPERSRRKHKKKKSRRHHESKKKSSREMESLRKKPSSIWIDDIGSVPLTPFYLDEKADKNNLCFQSLNFTDAAFYRRATNSCLGIDSSKQVVVWDEGKGKKSSTKKDSRANRYFEKLVTEDDVEQIPVTKRKDKERDLQRSEMEMPFIPVKEHQTGNSANLEGMSGEQHPDNQTSETSDVRGSNSERVAFFNRHLHENPNDVSMWLEFLRFQDQAAGNISATLSIASSDGLASLKSSKREQVVLEKKMSILEKALKWNPTSPELRIEQLELYRETLDPTSYAKRWEAVIRQHSENLSMWQQYLAFHRSCFAKFSVSSVASVYSKFLDAMQVQGTQFKFDTVLQLCHFWRQCGHTEKAVALLQALVEFNCFCPQHIEESTTLEGKIAFFEPFWDSNEPRFGEVGAEGWAKWIHRKEKGGWSSQKETVKVEEEDENVLDDVDPLHKAWLKEEVHRELNQFLPWRPGAGQTEDDCEDPDRMVLFDDISPYLINFDTPQQKFSLIMQFLDFLGVRRQHQYLSCLQSTRSSLLEHPLEVFGSRGLMSRREGGSDSLLIGGHEMSHIPTLGNGQTERMSAPNGKGHPCKSIVSFADNIISQAMPLFSKEAQGHLQVLQMQYNLPTVDASCGSKQRKKLLKEGQRYAKRLLSQESNRNNLSLWREYAEWEWHNGNLTESQRIFETALAFSELNLTAGDANQDITDLLSSYADLKLDISSGQSGSNLSSRSSRDHSTSLCKQEVLHALTALGECTSFAPFSSLKEKSVSAARILKARRGYVELYNKMTGSYKEAILNHKKEGNVDLSAESSPICVNHQGSNLVHVIFCYALFQYLSVSMQASRVVFEEALSTLEGLLKHVESKMDEGDRGVIHQQLELDAEVITVMYVRVVSHHVHSHPMPVTSLRDLLQRALRRYSTNAQLLEIFIELEGQSHIAGRLRRYFDRATSETNSPMPWIFAVTAEMQRIQHVAQAQDQIQVFPAGRETGISNRLRSLFHRATSNRHTRHCVLLWRLYMYFEVQQGDSKRGMAVFYRALQHCPWAKALFLDAVRCFPEELQEVLDLLLEKELRLRAPIEEVKLLMKVAKQNKQKD